MNKPPLLIVRENDFLSCLKSKVEYAGNNEMYFRRQILLGKCPACEKQYEAFQGDVGVTYLSYELVPRLCTECYRKTMLY